jgi:polyisoprenoid-binding protein YceI
MLQLDAQSADCRVLTFCEGLLAAVAHDLELCVTSLTIAVDEERRAVDARFDATSLRVLQALRGGRPLPDALGPSERAQIEATIVRDVLDATRFPEIRFTSSGVAEEPGGFRVTGTLALHGHERALALPVRADGDSFVAETVLHQPDFGIRPYTAMLGTLRVKPAVTVRVTMRRPR